MKILKEIKKNKEKPDFGKVGNDILYDMCAKYPYHNDESEIIAKVWLIGRAYAASIERNKINKNISDDFYSDIVAPKFKRGFDQILLNIRNLPKLKEDNIKTILETHKKVVYFIYEITKDNKRSFASKYLHFHFPSLFFIYDSRVAGVINEIFREIGGTRNDSEKLQTLIGKHDDAYANFFIKCFYLWEFCEKNSLPLSIRQIDSFLIYKANEKMRNKKINSSAKRLIKK